MKPPRNLWPWAIISVFALFITGTMGLVIMACSQRVDLVSSDYYEQEIKFQGHLDRARRAQRLAAGALVAYDGGKHQITIALPAEQVRQTVIGRIQLYRPSAAGLDRQFQLELDPNGVQSLATEELLPGLWKVRVSWTAGNQEFFIDQKVVIGPKTS